MMCQQRKLPAPTIWARIFSLPDQLISLAALAVAFGALCVSLWQLDMARQHNVLSVRPFLMVTPHFAGSGEKNGLYLTNEGIGLGIITSMSVTVSGKTYDGLGTSQWPTILRSMNLDPLCFSTGWPTKLAALSPGKEIQILGPSKKPTPGCEFALLSFLMRKDVSIALHYTSLYEEKYVFNGDAFMNMPR